MVLCDADFLLLWCTLCDADSLLLWCCDVLCLVSYRFPVAVVLCDVLRATNREKVQRVIFATFRVHV